NSNSDDSIINNNGINQEAARNYNPQNPTQLYQDLNSVSNLYPNSPNPTPNFYPNNPNPPPASLYQNRQLNTSDRQLLPPKRHNTLSSTSHNQNSYLSINSSRIQQ
ncbi:4271_t:CDS:1, partial [Entrophospora sp. SA101]